MSRQYESMIYVLRKSLEGTSGLVKVPLGDDDEIVLCYRDTNEEIDDPECEDVFQALSSGVFRRFVVHSGENKRYTWMRFTSLDPYEFACDFKRDFEEMSKQDLEGIKASLIFQKMKRDDSGGKINRGMSF